ncbi:ATP-binding protein [Niveibacterium terrae]|uniref:sensor histidine kinase n=1 Tax=Niveibacterium terrae TaxID=3373598 RepID=UPI003A904100
MNIRKTLLVAFLGVGLVPAILLASLAFVKARETVRAEVERNLTVQAAGVAGEVDKMMFERLQNAATWSRLDIMQDLQIRDVDKRLSRFLADLQLGYRDVYLNLSCADRQGRLISSSDAGQLGHVADSRPVWLKTTLSGAEVELELPDEAGGRALVMSSPITSMFTGERLGALRLTLDWTDIYDVLDQAAGEDRMLAILDGEGRLIAASGEIRKRGLLLGKALAAWRGLAASGKTLTQDGAPIADAEVFVGAARSHAYAHFSGLGWTTLVIQPVDRALAPVHRIAWIVLVLLGVVAVVTVFLATWVSRAIARPIVGLTTFTRGYMRNKVLQAPAAAGSGEVGELTEAFVQMVRDIDLSQQNLVRASKLAVVGEMSSIIAHEVRTPLGILRSSAQMLQREAGISEEGHELIGFIESETERLNRLVSAMLDTARPRVPSYGEVDMHELIRQSVAMLAAQMAKKQVVVSESLLAGNPVVECDEEQMTQVLLNLLMNGLQILDHGGRIDVASHDDGEHIYIEIADDGPGIDPAERARVFEAFFFKREGGVGLGLAIVQQIVAAHRGEIEATEGKLGGALFRIRLPRQQAGES